MHRVWIPCIRRTSFRLFVRRISPTAIMWPRARKEPPLDHLLRIRNRTLQLRICVVSPAAPFAPGVLSHSSVIVGAPAIRWMALVLSFIPESLHSYDAALCHGTVVAAHGHVPPTIFSKFPSLSIAHAVIISEASTNVKLSCLRPKCAQHDVNQSGEAITTRGRKAAAPSTKLRPRRPR